MSPSSYVILGLLRIWGDATPYDLKRAISRSIGYFWDFPQSQLYAEAARLTALGLVEQSKEGTGRRRRVLRITAAGRRALERWLTEPTDAQTEIRDLGLLKLFFAGAVDLGALADLAEHQVAAHRARLATYEALDASFDGNDRSHERRTLQMGLRFERASVAFWRSVLDDPPAARRRAS